MPAQLTTGASGVLLDSCTLTVERIVDNPRELGLGAVEASLHNIASRRGAQLLRRALGETKDTALRKHCGGRWKCKVILRIAGGLGLKAKGQCLTRSAV